MRHVLPIINRRVSNMPVINTNIAANIAVGYLNSNQNAETSALAKLSSGSRITSASDDAAGLAISTRINSDVVALQPTQRRRPRSCRSPTAAPRT
jgi:flagellin-like hook-associated protein FlgL